MNTPLKGELMGECNRTVCSNTPAKYYNYSTKEHYCTTCAKLINIHNKADSMRLYGHDLCIDMTQPIKI